LQINKGENEMEREKKHHNIQRDEWTTIINHKQTIQKEYYNPKTNHARAQKVLQRINRRRECDAKKNTTCNKQRDGLRL
jgi:hypothetical protein